MAKKKKNWLTQRQFDEVRFVKAVEESGDYAALDDEDDLAYTGHHRRNPEMGWKDHPGDLK